MEDFLHETTHYKFRFADGIFYMTYKSGNITLEIAKEIVRKRKEMMGDVEIWAIIDDANLRSIERDARQYLSSDAGIAGIRAGALVVSSSFAKHLANFFLKITVNKPKIPTRVFLNYEEALEWLKNLMDEATEKSLA